MLHIVSQAQGNFLLEMEQNTDYNQRKRFVHKSDNDAFVCQAKNLFDNFDSVDMRDLESKELEMLDFSHRSPPTMHSSSQNYNQSQDAKKYAKLLDSQSRV